MTGEIADFRRVVHQVFGAALLDDDEGLTLNSDGSSLRLILSEERPAQFGALTLKRFRVEIRILAGTEAAAARLLQRLDQATQKGGG